MYWKILTLLTVMSILIQINSSRLLIDLNDSSLELTHEDIDSIVLTEREAIMFLSHLGVKKINEIPVKEIQRFVFSNKQQFLYIPLMGSDVSYLLPSPIIFRRDDTIIHQERIGIYINHLKDTDQGRSELELLKNLVRHW